MKQPYEKPTLTDLSLPTARAGRLPGQEASPEGLCYNGILASPGSCSSGDNPGSAGLCHSGVGDGGQNLCVTGTLVR